MPTVSTDRRQGVNAGAAFKVPCRVATTANVTLSGLQTIDGVTLAADDRVLVKDQTTASENGIYAASTSSWQRAIDFDGVFDAVQGSMVWVNAGSTNAGLWRLTTSGTITPGTTSLAFEKELRDTQNAESIIVAISDESTVLNSGAGKIAFPFPYNFTLSAVRAYVSTVSSSGALQFDVNVNGASIFSTPLTIDEGEKNSSTAATPAVLSTTAITANDEITIDIDSAGSGAKGAKITLIGRQSL